MRGNIKAITPEVLIQLANNAEFADKFKRITSRIKSAPGVAYPCCKTQNQTLKAVAYWDRLLCSIAKLPAAKVAILKQILGGVDKILVRCKNEGRNDLFVL